MTTRHPPELHVNATLAAMRRRGMAHGHVETVAELAQSHKNLLAALRSILEQQHGIGGDYRDAHDWMIERARAAIAKATGGAA